MKKVIKKIIGIIFFLIAGFLSLGVLVGIFDKDSSLDTKIPALIILLVPTVLFYFLGYLLFKNNKKNSHSNNSNGDIGNNNLDNVNPLDNMRYWEKTSCMIAMTKENVLELYSKVTDRLKDIPNLKVLNIKNIDFENKMMGSIHIEYLGEQFSLQYYPEEVEFDDIFSQIYTFEEGEKETLKQVKTGIALCMNFHNDVLTSFHLQIKVINALFPDLMCIYDESSERFLPIKWIRSLASSNILPLPEDLYVVQAVSNNGEVWLHTHGLNRCNIPELEVLEVPEKKYNPYFKILTAYANILIHEKMMNKKEEYNIVALLNGNIPLMITSVNWMLGLHFYGNVKIGNEQDRIEMHNAWTEVLFTYRSEKDIKSHTLSKLAIYEDFYNDNPLVLVGDTQTRIMEQLARERFHYVSKFFDGENCLMKLGLKADDSDQKEHIWFKLKSVDGNKFKAEVLNQPYHLKDIILGNIYEFTIDDITDWQLTVNDELITPSKTYRLD